MFIHSLKTDEKHKKNARNSQQNPNRQRTITRHGTNVRIYVLKGSQDIYTVKMFCKKVKNVNNCIVTRGKTNL